MQKIYATSLAVCALGRLYTVAPKSYEQAN